MIHEHSQPSGDLDSRWTLADDAATKEMFMRLGVAYFSGDKPKRARKAFGGDKANDQRRDQHVTDGSHEVSR